MSEFEMSYGCLSDDQLVDRMTQFAAAIRTGDLSASEFDELNRLLEDSADARSIYLELSYDTQSLRVWAAAYSARPLVTDPSLAVPDSGGVVPFVAPDSIANDGTPSGASFMAATRPSDKLSILAKLLGGHAIRGLGWKAAAAAAFMAFLGVAAIAYRQNLELSAIRSRVNEQSLVGSDGSFFATARFAEPSPYVATLVNLTNCRWDRSQGIADFDQQCLQPGQSLRLLEGVAEINSVRPNGSRCTFQLEGPLSMTLTRDGMPSLLFGKLAGVFSGESDQFTLETPLGRIVVAYDASLGVSATANAVELHVFEGEASVEPLYSLEPGADSEHLRATAGVSLRIVATGEERLAVKRGIADEHNFVSQVSMAANRIEITEDYVAAIRAANPIAYWRFEGATDGYVRNEVGDRFHCRLYGSGLRWHAYSGNTAAEFGSTPQVSCLLSDDVLDGAIQDDYTLEAWVKPSHFHHAAVFSLAEIPSQTQAIARPRTGMLLELCGPVNSRARSSKSWAGNPGRFRFLHRNPPGSFTGISCFSKMAYVPRKWQHVATVKAGDRLRLYVDGALAAEAKDQTNLPSGMRVLIGQLHQHDPRRVVAVRPFVGELDEVALYNRALTPAQILDHCQLASPSSGANQDANDY